MQIRNAGVPMLIDWEEALMLGSKSRFKTTSHLNT